MRLVGARVRAWPATLGLPWQRSRSPARCGFVQPDPANGVVRVRIGITSRAESVAVATDGAVITNAALESASGGLGVRPVVEGGRVGYTGNVPGLEVDASLRATLARVRGDRVTFRIDRTGPGPVTIELANLNDVSSPQAVDRFTTDDLSATV